MTSRSMIIAAIGVLIIAVAAVFLISGMKPDSGTDNTSVTSITEREMSLKEREASGKRIDELVASFASNYREGKFEQTNASQDEWTSRPLTMVLMDVQSVGDTKESSRERITSMLAET